MLKKFFILCFVLFTVFSYSLETITFDDRLGNELKEYPLISRSGSFNYEFRIGKILLKDVQINGETFKKIILNNSYSLKKKGYPELRSTSSMIAVPYNSNINAYIQNTSFKEIDVAGIIPSKGTIKRNINPAEVEYTFSDIYKEDKWYPSEENMIKVSKPFIMRDVSGVNINIIPFQYNPVKKKLRVYYNMTINVSSGTRSNSPFVSYTDSSDFNNIYSDMFLNFPSQRSISKPNKKKDLLIVYFDKYKDLADKLMRFKRKIGFDAEIVSYSQAGGNPGALKSYLQKKYNQGDLCYVILFGNGYNIPTMYGKAEGAESDSCYVKLSGDDNIPDAFISRISASYRQDAEYQVEKIIKFQSEPYIEENWFKNVLGIASWEGDENPDFYRIEKINRVLRDKKGFNLYRCYDETYDDNFLPEFANNNPDKSVIFDAVKKGVSIIDYMGHGDYRTWITSEFDYYDTDAVENGYKMPVIWSVACNNGDLLNEYNDPCLAESWLRAGSIEKPAGSIGFAGASTPMSWDPPVIWLKHVIGKETALNINSIASVQNLYGVLKVMEEYGVEDESEGNLFSEQLIYFGDGTIDIRTEMPTKVEYSVLKDKNNLSVQLSGNKIKNICVTVHDEKADIYFSKYTDQYGKVYFENIQNADHITIYSGEIIPVFNKKI